MKMPPAHVIGGQFTSRSSHSPVRPKLVGLLAFNGVTAFDITGPCEILAAANVTDELGNMKPCYETVIVGVTGKNIVAETGFAFRAQRTLETAPRFDTIIIPGGRGLRERDTNELVSKWLVEKAASTRRFVSICTGIYGLAPSGLLNGRNVTTHWRFAHDVAQRFPLLHVKYAAAFLKDGPFYSSAGNLAGIDMVLTLIEEDFGIDIALFVAREFAMQLRPPSADETEVDLAAYQPGPAERLADLPCWILSHLQQDLSVNMLAARAGLCPRHFTRIFKRFFRTTPAEFVDRLRLNEARRRLLIPRYTVGTVADSVGFKSCDTFRRAFERRFGMNPTGYRNRFFVRATNSTARAGMRPAIVSQRKILAGGNN